MAEHVTELLSAHLDRQLSDAEEQRVAQHLEVCRVCGAQLRDLEAAVVALRSLPRERMPVPVRLPQAAPVALMAPPPPPRGSWLRRPWAVAGGGALAAAAAILVTLSLNHPPSSGPTALRAHQTAGPAVGAAAPSAPVLAPQAQSFCAETPVTSGSASPPAAFGTEVQARSESVPGEQLILATTSARVSPGQQILVFARVTGSNGLAVPCVSALRAASAPAAAAAAGQAGGDNATSEMVAQAQPTSDVSVAAVPLQVITVPANLAPGTQLILTASVPAPAGGAALTVQLPLTVG